MGGVRVTQGMIVQRTLSNINHHLHAIFRLQDQLATGLRVNSPSEDPIAVRRAIDARASIQRNEQYLANMESVGSQLTETTTTLQSVINTLQRAMELAIQGANGTNSQTQMGQIAGEVDQLIEGMLDLANHKTNDRYIFSGTRTKTKPFAVARDVDGFVTAVTYEGNDETIEVAVSDGIRVAANEPGSAPFMSGRDLFQVLIEIRDSLRSGDQASVQNVLLDDLDVGMEQVLLSMARIGAVQNRIERGITDIEEFTISIEQLLSDTIDADFAETILNLNAQSNAFQAALNAGARVIQPSLLDFVS
ncbi:MAG TPA: flagellar hook-associated protein 3 [Candidatus Hydrogenedentes bacterium]|nr:flagellar hook-associated protein 3 [Candidatus Hydrogenedentota bacterium]